ncbi:hypothetical protein [Nakamurella aerolata]|uniref:Uncharacterized protein n=1 Tax=Nakamurella aerolata TaxID=1656892 RepID=A0A849AEQ0_9ACTN|nr:hypothetical protein [Nakamurella aerolata]NNG36940.1 hypothetical protein [Nakamurella aerolata]
MAAVTETVVVRGQDGSPHVIHAGSEIPEWAEGQVGDHVRAEPKAKPPARRQKPKPDSDDDE